MKRTWLIAPWLAVLVSAASIALVSFNVVVDLRRTPGWEATPFTIPWLTLLVVFAVVYGGSVVATLVPARQAARLYPTQALRYE